MKLLFFGVALIGIGACSSEEQNREVAATVYDKTLFVDELQEITSTIDSKEDSIEKVNLFVKNWIDEQVLLSVAEQKLPDELKEVQNQLDRYRASLLIYAYEKDYVSQVLDTSVAEEELLSYYQSHKKDFLLKDYLVKVWYLKVPNDAPDLEEVEKAFNELTKENIVFLENYARKYSVNYFFEENSWLFFDDLLKEVPLKIYRKDDFIVKKRKAKVEEQGYLYFIHIFEHKLKDAVSPFELEKEKIRSIIINQRTVQLRKELRIKLLENAYRQNKVERY